MIKLKNMLDILENAISFLKKELIRLDNVDGVYNNTFTDAELLIEDVEEESFKGIKYQIEYLQYIGDL